VSSFSSSKLQQLVGGASTRRKTSLAIRGVSIDFLVAVASRTRTPLLIDRIFIDNLRAPDKSSLQYCALPSHFRTIS